MACIIGMYGQKSGPPPREVRNAVGPKKPSDAWVARMASIQLAVVATVWASPVMAPRSTYPLSQ